MSARRPALAALAERLGVIPSYRPADGGPPRVASDATREALVAAMGLDASSERAAADALAGLEASEAATALPASEVTTDRRVRVRPPADTGPRIDWQLELREEGGRTSRREGRARRPRRGARLGLPLPRVPGPGYHELRLSLSSGGRVHEARQLRIVAPARCLGPRAALGRPRGFGLVANLYALRSAGNWGAGDLGDLAALVRLADAEGADFVGVNPLHALWNRGPDVSPYLPVSRLHRNPLYLEVAAVPELRGCAAARRRLAEPGFARRLAALRAAERVDYAAVAGAQREILELLHERFRAAHRGRGDARGRAHARFLARGGRELEDFATFVALAEHLDERDWRRWPARFRDPRSGAVARFRDEHDRAVDYAGWVQFEIDRQLGRVAASARRRGLGIGLLADLALGCAPGGADTWTRRDAFVSGASAGAPPDAFSRAGQDWAFTPLDPRRMAERRHADWVALLRAGFAHAGGLRIDHVLGLRRLWWVPAGREPGEGAYVRYPADDLLGILALESRRHGAVVVGEDLGTVPRGLAAQLARRGVLSSRVLYFERSGRRFRRAREWSGRALATANTHDLPTLAAYFSGSDLALRRRTGQLPDDAALETARAERLRDRAALLRRLVAEGLLPRGADPGPESLAAAVAAFLCRTPAPLVGLAVDDLAGEAEPVNLPGVGPDRHPSWTRRLGVGLEELAAHPVARATLDAVPASRRHRVEGGERRKTRRRAQPASR